MVPAIAEAWLRSHPRAGRVAAPPSRAEADRAGERLRALSDYAPTPLRPLPDAARRARVAQVWLKDEGSRFRAGSFKALGAAHALSRALDGVADPAAVTIVCATDGNHGRAVAWAAQRWGARAVVFMPDHALDTRVARIRDLGGDVRLVDGNYDAAVAAAGAAARQHGWLLLSDTSDDPADAVTLDVMSGYALMVDEAIGQISGELPTHVFLQAGVGTFAAAVIARLVQHPATADIRFIIVEPAAAPCVLRSLEADAPREITGNYATIMDCLAAGRVSAPAWPILRAHAAAAIALEERSAAAFMRDAATDNGPSGLAGLAGLIATTERPEIRRALGLDEKSSVLVFGTEERVGSDE